VAFLEHPVYGDDDGFVNVSARAGRPERVTGQWQGGNGLAWSKDGREIWFTSGPQGFESTANGARYQLYAVRPGGRVRLVYGPPMALQIHDISPSGALLLAGESSRSELGGLLKGDTKERDLSNWTDEALGGIAQDGSGYAGIEQSAPGAGIEPFLYYRRVNEAPIKIGNGTAMGLSPDGRWVLSETSSAQGVQGLALFPTGPGDPRPLPIGRILPRAVGQEFARWSADGSNLLFPGNEPGRPERIWLFDLASNGPPRPATPEGCTVGVLSPDGNSVAAIDSDGKLMIYSAGARAAEVRGALPGEIPLEWETSGRALFVWDRTWPARIVRLELDGGRRTTWKELVADPVGLLYGNVTLTRDGQHYAYRIRRVLSELNVATGLR
jgi:eukaryotic-like serine/threonine-protein kinase